MKSTLIPVSALCGLLAACQPTSYGSGDAPASYGGAGATVDQADMQAFCRGEVLETIADSPFITLGEIDDTGTGFTVLADEMRDGVAVNTYECRFNSTGSYQGLGKTANVPDVMAADPIYPET